MTYGSPFLRRASALAILCSISAACSQGELPDSIYVPPSTGGNGNGNGNGTGGTDGTGGGEALDTAKPVVEVSIEGGTPTVANPAQGSLTALCTPEAADDADTSAIDGSTVKFTLLDSEGEELETIDGSVGDTAGTYSAEFALETYSTGTYTLSCSANNVASPAATGSASLDFLLDAGPTISLDSPAENDALQPARLQTFRFNVVPSPLEDGDDAAAVSAVSVTIKGNTFDAIPSPDVENQYSIEIDFTDTTKFPNLPNGETIFTISAVNSRGEGAATATLSTNFQFDGKGPVITIISPEPEKDTVVGQTVVLNFEVTDDISNIDPKTLGIVVEGQSFSFNETDGRWSQDGTDFSFEFDSTEFDQAGGELGTQLAIEISGLDRAGNESNAAAATYYRDNKSPIVTLAPPPFRERKDQGQTKLCSHSFSPVGDSPRGGEIPSTIRPRAIIWDETNSSSGQDVFYFSGTDQESPELWIRRASEGPLIEDTSGDGVCDDMIEAGSAVKELDAVNPTGNAFYGSGDGGAPTLQSCEYGGETNLPKNLCTDEAATDMTVVPGHGIMNSEPILYGLPVPSALECTGGQWQLTSSLPTADDWICMASRAWDNVGNRGVSIPVALCFDNPSVPGEPACASDLGNPPTCMKSCTAPKALPESGIIYDK